MQAQAAAPRVPRTTSVNSYKNYTALPQAQQAQLAEALQDEAVLAEKMDGVVGILQKNNQLPTNEEGEVELDLRCVCVWWGVVDRLPARLPACLVVVGGCPGLICGCVGARQLRAWR